MERAPITISSPERVASRPTEIRMTISSPRKSEGLQLGAFRPTAASMSQAEEVARPRGNLLETTQSREVAPRERKPNAPTPIYIKPRFFVGEKGLKKSDTELYAEKVTTNVEHTDRLNQANAQKEQNAKRAETLGILPRKDDTTILPNKKASTETIPAFKEKLLTDEEITILVKEKGVPEAKAVLARTGQTLSKELLSTVLREVAAPKVATVQETKKKTDVPSDVATVAQKQPEATASNKDKDAPGSLDEVRIKKDTFLGTTRKEADDKKVYAVDQKAQDKRYGMVAASIFKKTLGIFTKQGDETFRYSGTDLTEDFPSAPPAGASSKLATMLGIPDGSWIAFVNRIRALPESSMFSLLVQANMIIGQTRAVDFIPKKDASGRATQDEVALVLSGANHKESDEEA